MNGFHNLPPTKVVNHQQAGFLSLSWGDGTQSDIPHALIRQACRCSECIALQRSGSRLEPEHRVRIQQLDVVGHYALTFTFDDGHQRGIYPWAYLHELAECTSLAYTGETP
ncbi:gamma-butyrobetaine hydroxylase-like domain-containing protein [Limnobacter humi]|uniref:Gamma-butyrobetaine hydroxylase-like domain-containing protein n=1 Tax=Limnobacter humi TaxID=1778671 RepID=A0ABT1WHA8_9BURK|nr:gamma-butyrobetaine hydroxylase-like domain-containing protein [Limnobacter humi]MCQ8896421.1 gamma-butyrobetaine hydroxylase-like domain-containing protein [Limnobacter humi]